MVGEEPDGGMVFVSEVNTTESTFTEDRNRFAQSAVVNQTPFIASVAQERVEAPPEVTPETAQIMDMPDIRDQSDVFARNNDQDGFPDRGGNLIAIRGPLAKVVEPSGGPYSSALEPSSRKTSSRTSRKSPAGKSDGSAVAPMKRIVSFEAEGRIQGRQNSGRLPPRRRSSVSQGKGPSGRPSPASKGSGRPSSSARGSA